MKIRVITDTGTSYTATVDKSVKLTPHFALYEMANNKGNAALPQWEDSPRSRVFMVMLEEFRVWYDLPMTIGSGYRQEEYNRQIGGDSRSAHKIACACDWHIMHNEIQRDHVRDKWRKICEAHGVVGAINFYTHGYHLEAYSDICYGNKYFKVRDYRKTTKDW